LKEKVEMVDGGDSPVDDSAWLGVPIEIGVRSVSRIEASVVALALQKLVNEVQNQVVRDVLRR